MQRVTGLRHVQVPERAPGAADGIEAPPLAGLQQLETVEGVLDDLLGLLDRVAGEVLERKTAERQRGAGLDAAAVHVDQFQRAAAEIADDAVGLVEAGHHAERGQFRLALPGDDVDLGAADLLGRGDELLAVAGIAAGRRRHHPEPLHPHGVAQRAEALERRQRLLHRIGGQQPFGLHLAAEARERLLVEQRRGTSRYALVDHEPHRVRADIDHRDRRSVVEPPLRHGGGRCQLLKHARPAASGCGATIP